MIDKGIESIARSIIKEHGERSREVVMSKLSYCTDQEDANGHAMWLDVYQVLNSLILETCNLNK